MTPLNLFSSIFFIGKNIWALSIIYKDIMIPRLGAWYCGTISIKHVSLKEVKRHIFTANCTWEVYNMMDYQKKVLAVCNQNTKRLITGFWLSIKVMVAPLFFHFNLTSISWLVGLQILLIKSRTHCTRLPLWEDPNVRRFTFIFIKRLFPRIKLVT